MWHQLLKPLGVKCVFDPTNKIEHKQRAGLFVYLVWLAFAFRISALKSLMNDVLLRREKKIEKLSTTTKNCQSRVVNHLSTATFVSEHKTAILEKKIKKKSLKEHVFDRKSFVSVFCAELWEDE